MLNLCYVYYLSKLTEFADTIFFVTDGGVAFGQIYFGRKCNIPKYSQQFCTRFDVLLLYALCYGSTIPEVFVVEEIHDWAANCTIRSLYNSQHSSSLHWVCFSGLHVIDAVTELRHILHTFYELLHSKFLQD